MPVNRFYLPLPYRVGEVVYLEDVEFHHLHHVLRSREGDLVEIFNGCGDLATAFIESVEKKRALLKIEAFQNQAPPSYAITLAQAMPRANRLDFILEKGTELGVSHFVLFPGELGERKKQTEEQIDKLRSHLIAAAKQSGRLYLPTLEWRPSLTTWEAPDYDLGLYGDVSPAAPPFKNLQPLIEESSQVIFFVGPESGFHPKEIEKFREWGYIGVRLNENILRAETAAIAALTMLTHYKSYV